MAQDGIVMFSRYFKQFCILVQITIKVPICSRIGPEKVPILPESPFFPLLQHNSAQSPDGKILEGKHCIWCYFEVRMNCKGAFLYSQVPGHKFQASEEIVIDLHALLYCNICSSSYFNGTHTWFCREVDYVANTHFLVLIRLQI